MRDWAFAIMIGLIFISMAGCTEVMQVAQSKERVEIQKMNVEMEILKYEVDQKIKREGETK